LEGATASIRQVEEEEVSLIPHAALRAAIRGVWLWGEQRKEALARAKVRGVAKGYLCEWCRTLTLKAQVDHIVPCGAPPGSKSAAADATWDDYMSRMFIDAGGLQVLCPTCHRVKTNNDR
jgi:hypothetical protein